MNEIMKSLIVSEPTDDDKVSAGNCIRCGAYNELRKAERYEDCSKCNRKMLIIPIHWIAWFCIVSLLVFLFFTENI